MLRIAVASPSFSKNESLRDELICLFPNATFNLSGQVLSGDQLIEFLANADAAVIGTECINDRILTELPRLRYISKYGVGMDNLDQAACERHRISIGWTGGVNRTSVAEMTLAFMITLSRNMIQTALQLKTGTWHKNGGAQLTGKTVGIIGVGNIGKELIRLLAPFNCRILACDIVDQSDYYESVGVVPVELRTLLNVSDFVTIHTPLTPETRYLINSDTLALMKPTAFLVNTARGGIVNQSDLKMALKSGVIAGAALDTYETEPPADLEFLQLPNLFCTPHIGGNAVEAVLAMGRSAIMHLKDHFEGGNS